ncbi:MAG: urease accessory protein UreE [Cyanobacteria bacterium J083]|nr:MAG: urease accessory protein UreE [Cyanobacteria bacterium J083]
MLTFKQKVAQINSEIQPQFVLSLTAEERRRSRYRYQTSSGEELFVRLARGTFLQDGDFLYSESGDILKIVAKPEPVITVIGKKPLDLLKAAYHLGNRHIALEIKPEYLRLSPDPVLEKMLLQLNLTLKHEVVAFFPEMGAYYHNH